jgi:hypothetical protein
MQERMVLSQREEAGVFIPFENRRSGHDDSESGRIEMCIAFFRYSLTCLSLPLPQR